MYAILFSDEMVNRLEADIKICEHFNLDKTNPEFVHDARSILQSKINIVKGPYNVIRLETVDHDKKYAALFANAVYENLAAINRQIMINNLIYKKEVYRLNLDRWVSQSNKDAENFRQALYQLQTSGKSTRENPDEIFLLKRDLLNLISQYDRSASEQLKYEFKYQMASDAIIDSTLQTLYLINRAYPQNNYSSYFRAVMWSTGLCIAGAIYYCIMIFLVQKYKHNIKSIISTHQNEIHLNEIRTGNSNKNNEKLYDLKNSETEA
ncbi:MAG TPA: hypothetical protein VI757_06375 [Bacteroidia bacterium]|nr:hypothetical protein [Bacteroidia bacterium]